MKTFKKDGYNCKIAEAEKLAKKLASFKNNKPLDHTFLMRQEESRMRIDQIKLR